MDDVNVLVTFYSRTGSTERLAVWIAEGAIQAGAKIRLRRARDLMPAEVISRFPEWADNRERMDKEYAAPRLVDAQWADAVIIGTPDRDVVISTELKAYLDVLAVSDPERHFERKIGSVFLQATTRLLGARLYWTPRRRFWIWGCSSLLQVATSGVSWTAKRNSTWLMLRAERSPKSHAHSVHKAATRAADVLLLSAVFGMHLHWRTRHSG
jgi:hypothetical protein